VRLGIICDIGLTPAPVLRDHLEARGILELFDDTTFSDEVGWYKPDGRIFAHALERLGVSRPESAVHVGDRLRTDVGGARRAGMGSIRYRGVFDDVDGSLPEADHVVGDYDTVLRHLLR
jgi:putative hydrolase of the HAD superfamily